MAIAIGVDIGGTFTDLIAYDEAAGEIWHAKSSTTPHHLADAIFDCIAKAGLHPQSIFDVVHGTTVAINTAIERTGARTALLVTQGTRDVYAIGRGNRPEAYNIFFRRAEPLVPRHLTFEVQERLLASGEVLVPLNTEALAPVADQLKKEKVEAVAVCLLHAFTNPAHELAVGTFLQSSVGEACYLSLSHEIMRQYGEYERISTTVLNAYIGPKVKGYLEDLAHRLEQAGIQGHLYIMQSNGGVMTPETAMRKPVTLMESGPVGGIIASALVGSHLGFPNVIAFDMGGTTAKASLIQDGEPTMAPGYYIGGYASGHPAMVPVVDVVEVGAGGGSIAWIDEVGALKVGPQSAGADPGPIAYRRGGQEPTITDANIALGRIGAEDFLGGEMPLDVAGALRGIETRIAQPLGLSWVKAAQAIVDIAVAKMSLAVRQVSVEKGHDPRDFVLLASGGAGPLHAVAVARELNIPKVIIPRFPGHFSAFGMLLADQKHDFVQTYLRPWDGLDLEEAWRRLAAMAEEGRKTVALERLAERISHRWFFDMRYVGQEFTISVPLEEADLRAGDKDAIRRAFDQIHERHYGHHAPEEPVEVVNLRVTLVGIRPKPAWRRIPSTETAPRPKFRPVYLHGDEPVDCAIWYRDTLPAGFRVVGPAIIQEYASTTLLYPQDVAEVAETGEIVITLGGEA